MFRGRFASSSQRQTISIPETMHNKAKGNLNFSEQVTRFPYAFEIGQFEVGPSLPLRAIPREHFSQLRHVFEIQGVGHAFGQEHK
jgi:hypothetical protein